MEARRDEARKRSAMRDCGRDERRRNEGSGGVRVRVSVRAGDSAYEPELLTAGELTGASVSVLYFSSTGGENQRSWQVRVPREGEGEKRPGRRRTGGAGWRRRSTRRARSRAGRRSPAWRTGASWA